MIRDKIEPKDVKVRIKDGKVFLSKKTKDLYFRLRKEAFSRYNNYEIGVVSGITSGLILTISTFAFTHLIGETFIRFIISLIVSITVLVLLYKIFVTDTLKQQKEHWDKLAKKYNISNV